MGDGSSVALQAHDDLGDESADSVWDESADASSNAKTDTAAKKSVKPKKTGDKTFVQKNFNLIVAGVVIIGGGLAALSMMVTGSSGTAPAPAATETSQLDITETEAQVLPGAETPPMPAPMNSLTEEESAETAAPDVLTPMPDAQTGEEIQQLELAELNLDNSAPSDEELAPAPEPVPAPVEAQAEAELTPAPTDLVDLPEESLAAAETAEATTESLATPELQPEDPIDLAPPELVPAAPETNALPVAEEADAPEMPETAPLAPAPVANEEAAQEFSQQLTAMEDKISGINDDLSAKITATDSKIDALTAAIESLQKKVDALASAPVASPAAAPEAAPTEPPETKEPAPESVLPEEAAPAAPPPPKAQEAKPRPAPKSSSASDWQLRSAQPGQAIVALKGSNDLKTVAVGDSLNGIGRITSIAIENGKWTVRGTRGSVSQ